MLQHLKEKNPSMTIESIESEAFTPYGKRLLHYDFSPMINYVKTQIDIPESGNVYLAHDPNMKTLKGVSTLLKSLFGDMAIQTGYVNGKNHRMNALEYHKSSEVNIAVTPLVLLLGSVSDIKDGVYDSTKLVAFYVPEGTAFEVYGTTLHFSPCKVQDEGFKCIVLLPYGTNMAFIEDKQIIDPEDRLLFKTNKWLLSHPEHQPLVELGAHIGITGPNHEIVY